MVIIIIIFIRFCKNLHILCSLKYLRLSVRTVDGIQTIYGTRALLIGHIVGSYPNMQILRRSPLNGVIFWPIRRTLQISIRHNGKLVILMVDILRSGGPLLSEYTVGVAFIDVGVELIFNVQANFTLDINLDITDLVVTLVPILLRPISVHLLIVTFV